MLKFCIFFVLILTKILIIMKKMLFIFGLLAITSLNSCSENELENLSNTNISETKINQVLNEKDSETQKLMYSSLNPDEKLSIWDRKLSILLTDKKLNKQQKELLIELKNNISSDVFNNKLLNDEKEIFKNVYSKSFLEKAKKVFSNQFIVTSFYTLSSKTYNGENSCSCNIGAIFTCSYKIECRTIKVCKPTNSGCGFMTAFECDGNCDVLNPNS